MKSLEEKVMVIGITLMIVTLIPSFWLLGVKEKFRDEINSKIENPFERAVQSFEPKVSASEISLGVKGALEILETQNLSPDAETSAWIAEREQAASKVAKSVNSGNYAQSLNALLFDSENPRLPAQINERQQRLKQSFYLAATTPLWIMFIIIFGHLSYTLYFS